MTKTAFRIIAIIPVITILLGGWAMLVGDRTGWPEPAMQYLTWYMSSPPTELEYWMPRLGMVGLIGIVVTSIGVILLWRPSRYLYAISALIAVIAEVPTTPVLVGMPEVMLDNIAKIFLGICLGLMFTQPVKGWFLQGEKP